MNPKRSDGEKDGKPPTAGLYLVATPIGNARDLTLRALDLLAGVDRIACEDTRVTARLLSLHGLERKGLVAYHDHNGARIRPRLVAAMLAGQSLALVSDAGTPLVSDPGFALVREARRAGVAVTSLPGANAALTALQLSGLAPDRFAFLGFLPPRPAARRRALEPWVRVPGSIVVYETGPRLAATLADMAETLGPWDAAVLRELTKLHEEVVPGTLPELAARYGGEGPPKGEIVIVVGPGEPGADPVPDAILAERIAAVGLARAAGELARTSGVARRELYRRGLALEDERG